MATAPRKTTIRKMTPDEVTREVGSLLDDARQYTDAFIRPQNLRAIQYADGEMKDLQADEGRSAVVSHDIRAQIAKVKPSIHRTILGGKIAEYLPGGKGDEKSAQQATDYFNEIIVPESRVDIAIEDAIDDCLRIPNGVLKWFFEEEKTIRASSYTGLGDGHFQQLVLGKDVEVLEHDERVETVEHTPPIEMFDDAQGNQVKTVEIVVHDAKIIETITEGNIRVMAVPPEEIIRHGDTVTMQDSPLIAHYTQPTRSKLVALGHDQDFVYKLPTAHNTTEADEEDQRESSVELKERSTIHDDISDDLPPELEHVDVYECFVRIDADGDGIAELRRVVLAGDNNSYEILEDDYFDEVPMCDVISTRQAHQWQGESIYNKIGDLQVVNTVLMRQTLDNLYWQNNLQPITEEGSIINWDAVANPKFGEPIKVRKGASKDALRYNIVPFMADKSYAMMDKIARDIEERTGVSQVAAGLDPDTLQNVTAAATNMIERASLGQAEMMVREIARSLKPMLLGVLKLIVQHQDRPRTVRLRDEWVEVDPRSWNADMDAEINVGLGAGTREKDLAASSLILNMQKELLSSFGAANNPYVKHGQLYNSLDKMVQATGVKTTELFFTKPTDEAIQKLIAQQTQQEQQPDPQVLKVQAQIKMDQEKAQADIELDKLKALGQGIIAKEKQDAQLALEAQESVRSHQIEMAKIAESGQTARLDVQLTHDRKVKQISEELDLKEKQIAHELLIKADKLDAELAIKGSATNGSVSDVHIGGEPG